MELNNYESVPQGTEEASVAGTNASPLHFISRYMKAPNMFTYLFWLEEYAYRNYAESYTFTLANGANAVIRIDELAMDLWRRIIESPKPTPDSYELAVELVVPDPPPLFGPVWFTRTVQANSYAYHMQTTVILRKHDNHRRVLLAAARALWHKHTQHVLTNAKSL